MPKLMVPNTTIQHSIGFSPASYPVDAATRTTVYAAVSNISHRLFPMYSVMYYKPNNPRFAQQGATSSSALVSRIKFDTINSTAQTYELTLGKNVANALSYSVNENLNNYKAKLGYPMCKTPIFKAGHNELVCA
jgi:hypothetical protein